ncbi:MAG: 1-deoxy-D-xylulose-5-phosphate synthase [Defluviitaleaceae bacterium]|nr:1-deoxy-D-xylulose-5-phosphate synthase [Defluviitaleaceae bacterium]
MKLENFRNTKDLKRLSPAALEVLAADIRKFLIHSLSDTGGHLASNLGVVELTLALHTVFNTPHDKIVWDVGHQSYVHKILTGRKDRFFSLRRLNGLSGFPKIHESPHDSFGTGHSSTSISAALGLAIARDLEAATHRVVAVIGDGSMTGGLAYEGLNNAGRANTDLLVILNDNQMSISKNVGAISRHLNQIRTASGYLGAKEDVHHILDNLPIIGTPISKGIRAVKDMVKHAVLPGVLFEEMGFKYIGLVNGHDISALLTVLRRVRGIKGPVLVHVLTKKGKGYNIAERSPKNFHGVGTFCVHTGKPTVNGLPPSYTDVFSKHLCRRAAADERIVAISAAMPDGVGLAKFKERFPKRFFDVGIAESHAVTFAAGLARGGKRPVVAVYSSFLQRAYDQILHDVAIQNLPVIFAIDHGGAVSGDGETHQGVYDLSFLSHIPQMTILAPSSGAELAAMMDFAISHDGPVAIRYPKDIAPDKPAAPIIYGRSEALAKGKKIAIVAVGAMMDTAAAVVDKLKTNGHSPGLFNARFVKPLDMDLAAQLAGYSYVFTIEDGVRLGGYGARLQEAVVSASAPVPVSTTGRKKPPLFHVFAFPDAFLESGTRAELFARYKLDPDSITKKIDILIKESNNAKQKKEKSGT